VYRQLWPDLSQTQGVYYARWTIVVVLALGTVSAWLMGDFLSIVNLVLTVNLPFGAAVLLTYFWRRVTARAVWSCVVLSALVILIVPWTASHVPALRTSPALTQMSIAPSGRPSPVYFNKVVRTNPDDPASALVAGGGLNRFNLECWVLGRAGLDVAALSPTERLTAQFFFDGLFPFAVLIIGSLLTRPTDPKLVLPFYGKMKTPIGATPELEAAALEETRRQPDRFDHTKLFPRTNWEFCKWDRVDTIGFLACSAISGGIVGFFVLLLRAAAG
jgi:hypothetical protein